MVTKVENFFKSFEHAYNGIKISLKGRNLRVQLFIGFLAVCLGFGFAISNWEWLVITLLIFVVTATEILNTSIEEVCNCIKDMPPLECTATKNARDIAAGAVLLVSVGSLIIGGMIFIPKILELF